MSDTEQQTLEAQPTNDDAILDQPDNNAEQDPQIPEADLADPQNDNPEQNDSLEQQNDSYELQNDSIDLQNDSYEQQNDSYEQQNDSIDQITNDSIDQNDIPQGGEEEAYPEEEVETIESLREKQAEAINNLDFTLAQQIQQRIDDLANDNHTQFIEEYSINFGELCAKIARTHFRDRKRINQAYLKKEIAERTKMSEGFQELKKKHIGELQDLENALFSLYKERMTKPYTAHDTLIDRAKLTARRGDFIKAQEYQDQAEESKLEEEQKREELFKEVYKSRMNALLDKQSQEISEYGVQANVSLDKIMKEKANKISEENDKFRRNLAREYKKTCDFVTHSRYDAKHPEQQTIEPRLKPAMLNRLEDAYNDVLVKYGLESPEAGKKPKMIVPNLRPESQMSLRMQSRVESRENERKKKDEELRTSSKMSSRNASRQGSKLNSPKSSPRTTKNTL
ncbi:hypothetical protein TRFO_00866 [Tritrichomonas foetus]|uniref:Uncharacterized protein n=1 Tax=Tritrichomonas foetus TaxID=1144522 RepID=A0A1J4L3F4_9EUKA|nr:hypothetical protein TRFO_00866 [Tritrichomonas foetus]|eukprot:OHT17608.1 hypothetical protein TRFO_00866 [Tritrichomonas foetus]